MNSLYNFEYFSSAEVLLRETVDHFNNAYLSRSLSRLFDPINLLFIQGSMSIPSNEEINGVISTISRLGLKHVQRNKVYTTMHFEC